MPSYRVKEKDVYPYLVYEAPVDEKTKELRRTFDVDEQTGYPRKYNWRSMAKLGQTYNPVDPFEKFGEFDPTTTYGSKLTILLTAVFGSVGYQCIVTRLEGRPAWSRPHWPLLMMVSTAYLLNWAHDKSIERESKKNAIYVDYIRKHPDRFEPIYRPKLREVLMHVAPIR